MPTARLVCMEWQIVRAISDSMEMESKNATVWTLNTYCYPIFFICSAIDYCEQGLDNCDDRAECIVLTPGFSCKCRPPYEGDGANVCDCEWSLLLIQPQSYHSQCLISANVHTTTVQWRPNVKDWMRRMRMDIGSTVHARPDLSSIPKREYAKVSFVSMKFH